MKKTILLLLLTVIVRAQCDPIEQCLYTFELTDSQGNGWGENAFEVWQENNLVVTLGPQMTGGMQELSIVVPLCMNQPYFIVRSGQDDSQDEISLTIKNPFATTIYSYPMMQVAHQPQYFGTAVCTADDCQPPVDLQIFEYGGSPKLHWTVGDNSMWEVLVLPNPSTAPGDEAVGIISGCPFDLANYMDQPYDIYVRTQCFWGGTSAWESLPGYNMILGIGRNHGADFTIFPVPADDVLNISLADGIWNGTITDATGRGIMTVWGDGDATLNVSNLKTGLYFLTVSSPSGEISSQKFVVR